MVTISPASKPSDKNVELADDSSGEAGKVTPSSAEYTLELSAPAVSTL